MTVLLSLELPTVPTHPLSQNDAKGMHWQKAVVDGLVIARWVKDDTPEWVTVVDPLIVVGGNPRVELLDPSTTLAELSERT